MATFTGSNGNDSADAVTGTLTGFTGGTQAQLQDSVGDTFIGGNGADTIVAGSGDDTINIANGQFVAGESIQGGSDGGIGARDRLMLTNATTVNFSTGTVSGVETLTGSTGNDNVTMTASQLAGFSTIDLGGGTDVLNVIASGDISALGTPTVSSTVETGNLTGTTGNDTVTLTGAQLDAILAGSGTINLGTGTDTINLTSTSSDLNTRGATNASIQGVEAISASGATTGVTITLSGQTEAFTVTGSGQADTITGGSGADTIVAGGGDDAITAGTGADTIVAGEGNDTINIANGAFVTGESIQGGSDTGMDARDRLVLTNATTVNFSAGTVSGVETLTGSTGNDNVTMTASQLAGFSTIDLGGGTDVLNVIASGDITVMLTPTMSGIEIGNLTGTTGNDTVTLTGAQLDAIIIGLGTINLNTGTGDAINLTTTSNDLNTLGATNASISGVEAISAAGAAAGVTITLGGQTEAFAITGSNQADMITGGSAADTIVAGAGNDTINIATNQFATGESIQGGADNDQIILTSNGTTVNFSSGTVSGFETLTGSGGNDVVTMTASQWGGFSAINLGGGTSDVLHIVASGNITVLVTPAVTGIETGNLTGTGSNDTITLTGAQLDAIVLGSGTINLGSGSGDAINLTSTSSRLNALGAIDTSIQGVESISASGAAAAVTIALGGQTEALSITGSHQADIITGGSGADAITGGEAADTLTGGGGDDTFNIANGQFVAGDSIQGGTNSGSGVRDQIVLTSVGATADFTEGMIAGVETLTGSTGNDVVTVTGSQWAGLSTINLVSGTDTLNVIASGDISSLGTPTLSNVDATNLVGTSGSDSMTLTGAQLDALVGGSGAINLGANLNDTLNLTSTSADLNTLGNTAIQGVESISAAGAAAGVTINLSSQTEAFTVSGSSHADTITGGSGADTIVGGSGNDTIVYDGSDAWIAGGADIDTLVVNGAATINLSLLDQTSGDVASVSGFENVNASASSAAVTLIGDSGANELTGGSSNDTIRGGAGNDTINGGGGSDAAIFGGTRANYTVTLAGATYMIVDNRSGAPDGADAVTNVENFQFADGTLTAAQLGTTSQNKIALENMKQGNPISEWGMDGDGDYTSIQGFATEISANVGGTVDFKIATDSTHYRIDIYRLGYYGGDGARKVASIEKTLATAQVQPHPIVDMSRGLIDCGNWAVSASWQIPTDMVSGVYIAKLVREDGTEGASHIPFIVRDDASSSDIVFQTSDTTWQAYNAWGGASLYFGEVPVDPEHLIGHTPPNCGCAINAIGRAAAVSYNRPIITNTSPIGGTHDFIFGVEHSAIRWLEQNGYDVSYIAGVDTTRSGALLLNHDAFLSVGHDEYWSAEQRANVENARDSGVNLAFWSGNEVYWKVRWETSIDGNGVPYRTMVCYKETWGGTPDPSDTGTGTWRDPRFADPGQKPENALTGTMFTVDGYRLDTITVPYEYSNLRFWRNTDIAQLQPGETASLVQNLLGYEWDSDVENGFRPAGLINMSLSTVSVETYLRDYGTTVGSAPVTHSLTMYRAESGAIVFGAGTVFWSWGLDSNHEGAETPTDPNVQQAMVNMFADMGIQPQTLQASLILATQSTDHTAPVSTITSPTFGASFVEGQRVTITGTAMDFGGIIAGVEVSTDGGASWWKATGRENWSYSWIAQASATYTIVSRAVDDSLNLETAGAGTAVSVSLPSASSLWTFANKPTTDTILDRDGVELGVRFKASSTGTVDGIRFYKGPYNVGHHTVSLWTETGTLLATGVSIGESLTGWQTVMFSSPVAISAGTNYIASYHTNGYYSADANYFTTSYSKGFLSVQANGGVFAYGSNPVFPANSFNTNYWVDVVFTPAPNMAPTANGDTNLFVTQDKTLVIPFSVLLANDTDPNNDGLSIVSVTNLANGNGTVTIDASSSTIIFTPTAGHSGPATFSYTISDGRGATASANVNVSVQLQPAAVSLFQSTDAPVGLTHNDGQGLELGMRFTTSVSGTITAIRFYKTAGDTGFHTGTLWSSTGQQIATINFTNETASAWQTAVFSNPVNIVAGTTYIASYHTTGAYVADTNYFTTARVSGPLTGLASTAISGNGVYSYSAGGLAPTLSFQASNYWVDVVFNQSTVNGAPIANHDNGYETSQDTPIILLASQLLANDIDPDSDPFTLTSVTGASHGLASLDSQTGRITFTPSAGYTGPASFTYTVSDGFNPPSTATVNLTVTPPDPSLRLFSASSTPSVAAANDPNSVELGVKFTVSANGTITGLRYYKSAQDNGTHTASLWTSTGIKLASATFTNETESGWQTISFAQPVAVTVGSTYIASYHSNGFYSATPGFFATSHVNGPLTAPSSALSGGNGVYAYGTTSIFPDATFNSANYWIDVRYIQADNVAPVANNDAGFSVGHNWSYSFMPSDLLANDNDPNSDSLVITGVSNTINGDVVFDSQNNLITFKPTSGYTGDASFTYTISDGRGGTASAQVSMTVRSPEATQSLFAWDATPATVTVNDSVSIEIGTKFQADVAGFVTGIKFYKGPQNIGPHVAHLWNAAGELLATATFTNESASGWQTVTLPETIAIQADTTYVVSYHTDGFYSATGDSFEQSVSNGDLLAPSSGSSGGNGVYSYGSGAIFPTSSFNETNYYVDVAFRPQLAA